ncbi:MAG: histidine phosphatase family protein [Patescibacteria group bacterium]
MIALVRHGSYDTATGSLDDLGRRQAKLISDGLRGRAWQQVVTSPSPRCVETAQTIADELGITVAIDENWGEDSTKTARDQTINDLTVYVSHLPILKEMAPDWEPRIGAVRII